MKQHFTIRNNNKKVTIRIKKKKLLTFSLLLFLRLDRKTKRKERKAEIYNPMNVIFCIFICYNMCMYTHLLLLLLLFISLSFFIYFFHFLVKNPMILPCFIFFTFVVEVFLFLVTTADGFLFLVLL